MTRDEALTIYLDQGPKAAADAAGVSLSTIQRWASAADLVTRRNREQTEAATRAAHRITQSWADFRESEALSAGAAAARLRREVLKRVESGKPGTDLRGVAIAYGIFVDKAEILSNQATARIEVWAESEVDVELRRLIAEMEEVTRGDS